MNLKRKTLKEVGFLCACTALPLLAACTASGGNEVSAYVTTADRAYDLAKDTLSFTSAPAGNGAALVRLDAATRYQEMDGFGAAITGSTSYNLSLMPEEVRKQFLAETFSPDRYGFSYVRVPIGCSDFSLSDYTCCDTPGIENFALTTEETKYIIPTLKEILAINSDLKILASPWTCPRWMKVKDLKTKEPFESWTSGHLNPDYRTTPPTS